MELGITGISAPSHVRTGDGFTVAVAMVNNGSENASDVEVELYADDVLCKTVNAGTIDAGAATTFEFKMEMSALSGKAVSYKAVVSYPGDAVTDNNSSEIVTVSPVIPSVPSPANLMARSAGTDVVLNWDAPDLVAEKGKPSPTTLKAPRHGATMPTDG